MNIFAWLGWWRHEDDDRDEGGLAEATEAREKSEADLRRIRGQRGAVERQADYFRNLRNADHLAELFEQTIRRKPDHG